MWLWANDRGQSCATHHITSPSQLRCAPLSTPAVLPSLQFCLSVPPSLPPLYSHSFIKVAPQTAADCFVVVVVVFAQAVFMQILTVTEISEAHLGYAAAAQSQGHLALGIHKSSRLLHALVPAHWTARRQCWGQCFGLMVSCSRRAAWAARSSFFFSFKFMRLLFKSIMA